MTTNNTSSEYSGSSLFVWILGILSLSVVGIGFTFLSVSCVSQAPITTLGTLPVIDGATPIGSTQCSLCHPATHLDFEGATHANLGLVSDGITGDQRCESCHGPGSLHMAPGVT